jgi:hypothetical protein
MLKAVLCTGFKGLSCSKVAGFEGVFHYCSCHHYLFQSEQWKKLLANTFLIIFAIIVTPSNTEILNEHTVNHIFQYPNGESVHSVINNFEDFQKIQNPKCGARSNSEGNSRENFKTARNWWIFIINIKD